MKKHALTEEIHVEEKEEEIEEERPDIEISQSKGNWEGRLLGGLIIGLLATGTLVGIFGHLTADWPWLNAFLPDLLVVFGIVAFFMAQADKPATRAFFVGLGILILISYVMWVLGFMFDGVGALLNGFKPNITYVQNVGGYDSIKYSVFEYFRSLPLQLIIATAITMMSYVGIRIGHKKVYVKFHLGMMIVELLIIQSFFWSTSIIDASTSLATNVIFFMGIIMSGYWSNIVDCFLIPRLSHVMKSDSAVVNIMGNIIMAPIMMIGMALAVPISFAFMALFVNETALTMTLGFKIITQGYIVGALINGAIRELYIITRRPVKRSYFELDEVLE